jgi:GTP pyrophosphokinase
MPYGPRFDAALSLACQLHRNQVRKGSAVPYITHLLAVAAIVGENGGSEDEAIAALLHDAIEDQGGTATEQLIRAQFGDTVADVVRACTDADSVPKPPWRQRKEAYLAHLPSASRSALLVSIADKVHNARSIVHDLRHQGELVWRKFTGGKEGSLWYYRSLCAVYQSRGDAPARLVAEFCRLVDEMEREAAK